MKTLKILFIILFTVSTLVLAQIPNVNDVKKTATSTVSQSGNAAYLAAKTAFNKAVKDIPFAVNSYALPLHNPHYTIKGIDIDQFMKTVLIPALSKLINVLPTDKKVVITGHASSTGSEEATDNFMGNTALSKKRAEAVLQYILNNSQLNQSKFKIEAKGSKDSLPGIPSSSSKNCRVSIDIQ